jgi:hypothetical protein
VWCRNASPGAFLALTDLGICYKVIIHRSGPCDQARRAKGFHQCFLGVFDPRHKTQRFAKQGDSCDGSGTRKAATQTSQCLTDDVIGTKRW